MAGSVLAIEKFATSSSGSSEGDILDLKDDEGWEDAEPEEETDTFISLLDDEVFTDIMQMLNHCKEKHNFDFLELRQRLGLDFYGNIKLVNFIRSQVHSGNPVSPLTIEKESFEDEKYLKPVLEDDALLFNLDELPEVQESSVGKGREVAADSGPLVARISELEEEIRRIQSQFHDYRTTVKETLDERWNNKSTNGSSGSRNAAKEEKRDDDSHYFSSYSYNGQYSLPNSDSIFSNMSRYPRDNAQRHHPNRRLPGLHLQPQIPPRR
jgi:protein arginine N-methyltransferase 3